MRLFERLHFLHRAWRYRLRAERDELAFVLSRDLRGATVLDIGANRGIYSYWMHRVVGATGQVIAFEPQPELVQALRDLKTAFALHRLTIVDAGLSSHAGAVTLVRPRHHWGGASLHLGPDYPDSDCLPIRVMTLDEYFAGRDVPPVRLIKCDVQDHEEQVFRGGERLLREQQPDLLFEQHDSQWHSGPFAGFLADLGYAGHFFFRGQLTPIERLPDLQTQIHKPYLNYVFTAQRSASQRAA